MENSTKSKITIKQAYILFLLSAFSPLIRLSASPSVVRGRQAVWVSVLFSCLIYFGLIFLYGLAFSRTKNTCLITLYKTAFGKALTKIIILAYAVWVFVLAAYYLRMFSEQFAGSIMPGVSPEFFTITLLALIYIIISGKLQSFTLMSEVFFYIVLLVTAALFMLQLPKTDFRNLLPVTTHDTVNIFKGIIPSLSVFIYITPLLLSGDNFAQAKSGEFKKYGFYSTLVLLAVNLIIVLMTAGVFGAALTQKMQRPFQMSVKTVGFMGSLERPESVFLLLWVVTDLAVIVLMMYALLKCFNVLFAAEKPEIYKTPLICGVYIGSLYLKKIINETELSEKIGFPVNLGLGFIVPLIAIGVLFIRTRKTRT
ncbi:MAG: spore germination protein [Oscillospiraceae bacterium]|nr:spore germination protein [Oscillospiraceae bacterium]